MKNILARGGIEFIAVLLGISGSLYIDDLQNQNEMKTQISKSMHALIGELNSNSEQLSKLEEKLLKDLPELDKLIKKDSIDFLHSFLKKALKKEANPSPNFKRLFPTKPSQTTTSTVSNKIPLLSTLPINLIGNVSNKGYAANVN